MMKYFTMILLGVSILFFAGCKKTRENIGKSIDNALKETAEKAAEESVKKRYEDGEMKPEICFDDPKIIAICHAIIQQDVVKMEQLIADGADVNAIGKVITKGGKEQYISLLLWSFPFGENVLECLLKHGADPNYLYSERETLHKSFIYIAVEEWFADPRLKNYIDILLKYGADPDLGDNSPLIPAALHGNYTYHALVSLVESGADLNKSDIIGGEYPVTAASRSENYTGLFYLLESGAAYDPVTIPGGTMQRILYKKHEENKHLTPEQQEYIKKNFPDQLAGIKELEEDFKKVTKWLEDHGVSFDKPVPFDVSTQKPEPFRVNNKLIEMRQNKNKVKK